MNCGANFLLLSVHQGDDRGGEVPCWSWWKDNLLEVRGCCTGPEHHTGCGIQLQTGDKKTMEVRCDVQKMTHQWNPWRRKCLPPACGSWSLPAPPLRVLSVGRRASLSPTPHLRCHLLDCQWRRHWPEPQEQTAAERPVPPHTARTRL